MSVRFKQNIDSMFDAIFGKSLPKDWQELPPTFEPLPEPTTVFTNASPSLDGFDVTVFAKQRIAIEKEISKQLVAGLQERSHGSSYALAIAHEEAMRFRRSWDHWNGCFGMPRHMFIKTIADDIDRPRRYSGNSHQRRKQRRAQRRTK